MRVLLLLLCCLPCLRPLAQVCTNPGQTPQTALPVCGTSVFTQQTVPLCGGRSLPSPACSADPITDVNPFYYKFTCFEAGTLGFSILPKTNSDDYDWELYDITGRRPDEIFTDGGLVVSSNWSGEGGETGAGPNGRSDFVCAGFGQPLWSTMPQLIKGHNYLLLISHFTQSQSGYDLAFKGGTAVITDPLPPAAENASVHCDGRAIRVKLNKKLRCNSLAANGSDFLIMPGNLPAVSAAAVQCSQAFDTDSVEIVLAQPLDPGEYTLVFRNGTDNNTMIDFCDKGVPVGQSLAFTRLPALPIKLDSIAPVGCNPKQLQLLFKKPVYCNTVAPDGSDFVITGPYPVQIVSAGTNCTGAISNTIVLAIDRPLGNRGQFKITIRRNATGGTVVDECGLEVAEGSVWVDIADTVDASFTFAIDYNCDVDRVRFQHAGGRGINSWRWWLDEGQMSQRQNPEAFYRVFNTKNARLIVNNGVCSDTAQTTVALENFLSAGFEAAVEECPNEEVLFTSTAVGRGLQHSWAFGDGGRDVEQNPVHRYAAPYTTRNFTVEYTVTDSFGCSQSVLRPITIYSSCTVYVPNAFTPGDDGRNDRFRPLNVLKVTQYELVVYNRWGQIVFRTRDPKEGWDGSVNGRMQNTGTYVWTIRYIEPAGSRAVVRKGSVVLIR